MISPSADTSEEEKKKREAEIQYQDKLEDVALHVIPALGNPNVITILKLLNLDLTPNSMGNIFDLIQHDMNGQMSGLASKREIARFERSINHPEVFTENARHLVSTHEPPPSPMYQNEAEGFIKNLVRLWLQIKRK